MTTTGLTDFLRHIKSNPQNDVLIDRFTALIGELDAKSRRPYMEQLLALLATTNPHGSLRAAYSNLQAARSQAPGTPDEVEGLQWVEKAFAQLGKADHASLVRDEWERLQKSLPPPVPEPPAKKKTLIDTAREKLSGKVTAEKKSKGAESSKKETTAGTRTGTKGTSAATKVTNASAAKKAASALAGKTPAKTMGTGQETPEQNAKQKAQAETRFTQQRANFIASLYENFGQQLLKALETQLAGFKGEPQSEAAATHIIQSFRNVYSEMKSTLRNALAVFGHNPLLVNEEDKFREELVKVFQKSRLFHQTKDRIVTHRIRLVVSLMTAWFDQQQSLPQGLIPVEHERIHSKLLEMAVTAALRFED